MNSPTRVLMLLPELFAVCRLAGDAPLPGWATGGQFFSITRTAEELSIVCAQSTLSPGVRCEKDWRCVRVDGPISFSTTGVLAALVQPLAEAAIGVFAISTFDTDYLLVKAVDVARATEAWRRSGHTVQ